MGLPGCSIGFRIARSLRDVWVKGVVKKSPPFLNIFFYFWENWEMFEVILWRGRKRSVDFGTSIALRDHYRGMKFVAVFNELTLCFLGIMIQGCSYVTGKTFIYQGVTRLVSLQKGLERAWIQTERAMFLALFNLMKDNFRAAEVIIFLIPRLDKRNCCKVGQMQIADAIGCSRITVTRALGYLENNLWIKKVADWRGGVKTYVVNDRAVWTARRESMGHVTLFSDDLLVAGEVQLKEVYRL